MPSVCKLSTRSWIALVWLALGMLLPCPAHACDECIAQQAWVSDPAGAMALPQVMAQPEQRFSGVLAKGFGNETLWIRLHIDPARAGVGPDERLHLIVRPAYLDKIALHDPLRAGMPPLVMGDQHAIDPANASPTLTLPLVAGDRPRDLWVSLKSTSSRIAHFSVVTDDDLRAGDMRWLGRSAVFLGVLSALVLWGLVMALAERQALTGLFLCVQLAAWVYTFCGLGIARAWVGDAVPPEWIDRSVTYATQAYVCAGFVFNQLVLNELNVPRWTRRLFACLMLVFPLDLALALTGQVSLAQQINSLMTLIGAVFWVVCFHLSRPEAGKGPLGSGLAERRLIGTYFWVLLAFLLASSATLLGWQALPKLFTVYSNLMVSTISGAMMLAMAHYRSYRIEQHAQSLQVAHQAAVQRAQQEHMHREEKERLLAMLSHELKTPLAAIGMLTALREMPAHLSQQINGLVKAVGSLLDRSTQSGNIEDGRVRVRAVEFSLGDLLQQVCGESAQPCRIRLQDLPAGTTLRSDPVVLGVILRNLVENALKYSPQDSVVTILLDGAHPQGAFHVDVRNLQGVAGVPDPLQLFSKFYRSPEARFTSGSGLGLYISRGLAATLGAELSYLPDTDGIRFRLAVGWCR